MDVRVDCTSLIVTSNCSLRDWYPPFPNTVLADSAVDGLGGAARQLTLTCRSYRPTAMAGGRCCSEGLRADQHPARRALQGGELS